VEPIDWKISNWILVVILDERCLVLGYGWPMAKLNDKDSGYSCLSFLLVARVVLIERSMECLFVSSEENSMFDFSKQSCNKCVLLEVWARHPI
jgi:hypothetical protein